ncbi:MAG: DUF5722 domain-containing protein [Polyangiales bacterium]
MSHRLAAALALALVACAQAPEEAAPDPKDGAVDVAPDEPAKPDAADDLADAAPDLAPDVAADIPSPDVPAMDALDASAPDAPRSDVPAMDAPAPDAPAPDAPAPDAPPPDASLGPPLPYPTRSAYRIKALQPDFWPNLDEVVGNNTGGVAVNLLWAEWEPAARAEAGCTGPNDLPFDGHCYTIPANVDDAIRRYSARGVAVTGIVYGSPAWARGPCTPPSPPFAIFCAPRDPQDFARFAGALARRYDGRRGNGRVADFVIWNEVNSNDWFDIGCGNGGPVCDATRWVDAYAALYAAAYDRVVAEQPAARVLVSLEHHFGASFDAPGASTPVLSGETMLRGLAARVGARAWRVAYHPYAPDLLRPDFSPDDWPRVTYGNLGTLVGWLRRTFPSTPSAWEVELTESGVNSVAPRSSPEAQARAVCDTFRNVLGTPGIDNYVYHRMVDHPVELADGLGLGLRNPDGSAKPAWAVWALANRNDLSPSMLSCGFEELPYTRLRRSYHATRGHWASSRLAPAGFREESSWWLWRDPQPGTHPLYECLVGQHTMLTPDVGCEGQHPMGPVGYIHDAPAADTAALYRCYIPSTGDHFVSTDPACEGQRMEQRLGYARTRR